MPRDLNPVFDEFFEVGNVPTAGCRLDIEVGGGVLLMLMPDLRVAWLQCCVVSLAWEALLRCSSCLLACPQAGVGQRCADAG